VSKLRRPRTSSVSSPVRWLTARCRSHQNRASQTTCATTGGRSSSRPRPCRYQCRRRDSSCGPIRPRSRRVVVMLASPWYRRRTCQGYRLVTDRRQQAARPPYHLHRRLNQGYRLVTDRRTQAVQSQTRMSEHEVCQGYRLVTDHRPQAAHPCHPQRELSQGYRKVTDLRTQAAQSLYRQAVRQGYRLVPDRRTQAAHPCRGHPAHSRHPRGGPHR